MQSSPEVRRSSRVKPWCTSRISTSSYGNGGLRSRTFCVTSSFSRLCLFAEDLGQLPAHRFTQIVDDLIANPHRSSADDLGGLFDWLNDPI